MNSGSPLWSDTFFFMPPTASLDSNKLVRRNEAHLKINDMNIVKDAQIFLAV